MSIRRHKILYSLINNTEDVVKDTTREEVPLEHNIVYDETKPSNEQQQQKQQQQYVEL